MSEVNLIYEKYKSIIYIKPLTLIFFKFIYFECGGRVRERRRERIPSRLCIASAEPDAGLDLTHPEIMT